MKTIVFPLLAIVLLSGCINQKEKSASENQSQGVSQLIAPPLVAGPTSPTKVVETQEISPKEFVAVDATLGSDQTIESLAALDSKSTADWLNYVEFAANNNFEGIFKFDLEKSISEVKSLKLKFNYFGTSAEFQHWKFSLKDINTNEWVIVADNSHVTPWVWSKIEIEIAEPSRFVNLNGTVELRYSSEFAAGATYKEKSYLDYLALEIRSL